MTCTFYYNPFQGHGFVYSLLDRSRGLFVPFYDDTFFSWIFHPLSKKGSKQNMVGYMYRKTLLRYRSM